MCAHIGQATHLLQAEKMKNKAKSAELNILFLRLKQQSKSNNKITTLL